MPGARFNREEFPRLFAHGEPQPWTRAGAVAAEWPPAFGHWITPRQHAALGDLMQGPMRRLRNGFQSSDGARIYQPSIIRGLVRRGLAKERTPRLRHTQALVTQRGRAARERKLQSAG